MGCEEPACSGSEHPPGFEDFNGEAGPSNLDQVFYVPLENLEPVMSSEERRKANQSCGDSLCSFSYSLEEVP